MVKKKREKKHKEEKKIIKEQKKERKKEKKTMEKIIKSFHSTMCIWSICRIWFLSIYCIYNWRI